MADLAAQAESPIVLVGGDPNFTTPRHIIDSAAEAARGGATGYTAAAGIAPLREAIAEKVRNRNGIEAGPENVCVTTGGCGGLFTSMLILLEPGDEVLVPDPGWSNYPAIVHTLSSTPVPYPLDARAGFALDPDAIEPLVSARTRAMIINSPSNPTGAVESADRLAAALEIARRHDLWLISDECYDELVFDGGHVSTATLGDSDRVITIFTFSKSYAMTGWRIGYAVGLAAVIEQLAMHQEPVVTSASTISQHGAWAALRGPQDCVEEMRNAYMDRRHIAAAELERLAVAYVRPRGGFFVMADISETGLDSWTFARRLLAEENVAVVPGAAFGARGEGYVRISLAAAPENVETGTRLLAQFVDRLRVRPGAAQAAAPS